jgi:hypothetical protein
MTEKRPLPELDEEDLRQVRQVFDWVRGGVVEPVAALLRQGLPANLLNEKGDSLLMLAAYHGHAAMAALLLQHGADPELRNDRGQVPLAGAAFKGDLEVVRVLLDHGAHVDAVMADGRTAFTMAAMFDRVPLMELLVERGADAHVRDHAGVSALEAAARMGADHAVAWLTQVGLRASRNSSDPDPATSASTVKPVR